MPRRRKAWSPDEVPPPWTYFLHPGDAPDDGCNGMLHRRRGGMEVTDADIMRVFDSLPQELRTALASANEQWAPHWAREVFVWERFSSAAIVERISQADRDEAERRERDLMNGRG